MRSRTWAGMEYSTNLPRWKLRVRAHGRFPWALCFPTFISFNLFGPSFLFRLSVLFVFLSKQKTINVSKKKGGSYYYLLAFSFPDISRTFFGVLMRANYVMLFCPVILLPNCLVFPHFWKSSSTTVNNNYISSVVGSKEGGADHRSCSLWQGQR